MTETRKDRLVYKLTHANYLVILGRSNVRGREVDRSDFQIITCQVARVLVLGAHTSLLLGRYGENHTKY